MGAGCVGTTIGIAGEIGFGDATRSGCVETTIGAGCDIGRDSICIGTTVGTGIDTGFGAATRSGCVGAATGTGCDIDVRSGCVGTTVGTGGDMGFGGAIRSGRAGTSSSGGGDNSFGRTGSPDCCLVDAPPTGEAASDSLLTPRIEGAGIEFCPEESAGGASMILTPADMPLEG